MSKLAKASTVHEMHTPPYEVKILFKHKSKNQVTRHQQSKARKFQHMVSQTNLSTYPLGRGWIWKFPSQVDDRVGLEMEGVEDYPLHPPHPISGVNRVEQLELNLVRTLLELAWAQNSITLHTIQLFSINLSLK